MVKIIRVVYLFVLFILMGTWGCNPIEVIKPAGIETNVTADSVVFAIIGDYGRSSGSELAVSEMVKSWNPDFIITTGDNNYPEGEVGTLKENIGDYYGDYIYNYDAPDDQQCNGKAFLERINRFFPSPGNHDTYSRSGLAPYLNYFTLPGDELNYTFTWGDIAFYSVNSTEYGTGEEELWLQSELEKSNKAFHIVYFHHSPYSTGKHGNAIRMQWDFHSYGVDAVLTGHDHIYSRIEKKSEPGLQYIVNGAGGKSLYSCGDHSLNPDKFSVVCSDSEYGAVRGRSNSEILILEFFGTSDQTEPIDIYIFER